MISLGAPDHPPSPGIAGRLAAYFIDSKLTPLITLACVALGGFSLLELPREEEPQILVPMIDVSVSMPGSSPAEVENRVTRPLEKLLWEVPGVEYLYSTSRAGAALVTVRHRVGEKIEPALVRIGQKLQANFEPPPGSGVPHVKARSIDDVPVLTLTLHSESLDQVALRQLAGQLEDVVKAVPDVAETTLTGGFRRTIRILLDPAALAARNLDLVAVAERLAGANRIQPGNSRAFGNREVVLEAGSWLHGAEDVADVVIGLHGGRPVFLREVAAIQDGPEEAADHVLYGAAGAGPVEAAVTLALAKRPGANAIEVVERVLAKVETVRGRLLPREVGISVGRDYGHTAAEKSDELLLHMGLAVLGVALLILLFLGWRESLVVLLAIPATLALTLLVFHLVGYTLNRITLFALIFSIGILVDDAIVVVENIARHLRLPGNRGKGLAPVALAAVAEVGNPTLLATWAVIAAILPMAFVGGLMGPYMRPIPVGASAAMLFSLLIAFAVAPWAAVRLLRTRDRTSVRKTNGRAEEDPERPPADWFTLLYYRAMQPLLSRPAWRWSFLGGILVLLAGSIALVPLGFVQVKMLPFDNKSEFQVILNAPEGTTLEQTTRIALEMAAAVRTEPEVRDVQIYAGTAAPFNFSGLVRHYFLRRGPHVADLQVNLVGKGERSAQSHEIARRLRPHLAEIAARFGAVVAVAEVPPGPPVLQTLVAEIYGPDAGRRTALASEVRNAMERMPGVVDVDWSVEDEQRRVQYVPDAAKAAQHGVSVALIADTLAFASQGREVGRLQVPEAREAVPLRLELPDSARATPASLLALQVRADRDPSAVLVPLSELVRVVETTGERSRHRKNLKPVIYVTADVAGAVESPGYALVPLHRELAKVDARRFGGDGAVLPVYHLNLPADDTQPALKWDGEWHITLEVFRDLGTAFAAVLVLIALLLVGWFRSYVTPLVVMAAIPFSLVGILPAHGLLGGFFTATSMIGFMAGAGIVVRNSIILVDFIEAERAAGRPLRAAVIDAGAIRFRPMLLTALAVVVGASVILADPIFQGLAISLLFGEIASLLISRMAVPVLYYMLQERGLRG